MGLRLCAGHVLPFFHSNHGRPYLNSACFVHWETGLGLLVSVKRNLNATEYKDITYNGVLPTLWHQSGEEPHKAVVVRAPHNFGHTVFFTELLCGWNSRVVSSVAALCFFSSSRSLAYCLCEFCPFFILWKYASR